jgi:hypothetical protein
LDGAFTILTVSPPYKSWSTWTTKRLSAPQHSPAGRNITRNCSGELVDRRAA